MCRPIWWVFVPFWSENGCTLCLFWSGIGYGFFQGTTASTGVYEGIYRNGFDEFFCLRGRGGGKFVCVCNCGVASIVFSGKSGGKKSISLHVFPNGMRHFENTPIYNEFRQFILHLFVCVPRVFFAGSKLEK